MPQSFEVSARAAFEAAPRALRSNGSLVKPAVYRVGEPGDGAYGVKDIANLSRWLRPMARFLLRREERILERLQGIAGAPQFLGRIDADAYVFAWCDGRKPRRWHFEARPRELMDQLLALLDQIHARGVYHMDVRHCGNLVLDPDGRLHLIDFGASLALGPIARRFLGGVLHRYEKRSALKHLARYRPDALTREEAAAVVRVEQLRRLWVFSRFRPRGEDVGARRRRDGLPVRWGKRSSGRDGAG